MSQEINSNWYRRLGIKIANDAKERNGQTDNLSTI